MKLVILFGLFLFLIAVIPYVIILLVTHKLRSKNPPEEH